MSHKMREGRDQAGMDDMTLDHYVTLGRSGLRVSPFCLGTMTFGEDWGWGTSVEDSYRILDAFMGRSLARRPQERRGTVLTPVVIGRKR